jgi:hypothetical protein
MKLRERERERERKREEREEREERERETHFFLQLKPKLLSPFPLHQGAGSGLAATSARCFARGAVVRRRVQASGPHSVHHVLEKKKREGDKEGKRKLLVSAEFHLFFPFLICLCSCSGTKHKDTDLLVFSCATFDQFAAGNLEAMVAVSLPSRLLQLSQVCFSSKQASRGKRQEVAHLMFSFPFSFLSVSMHKRRFLSRGSRR